MKVCARCKESKPLDSFTSSRRNKDGRYSYCKACCNARRKPGYHRARHLRVSYGITVEEYDAMLERQAGVCAVCGTPPLEQLLCVDHDHTTGAVRGLLCDRCNVGLGCFDDDPARVEAAARYLLRVPVHAG